MDLLRVFYHLEKESRDNFWKIVYFYVRFPFIFYVFETGRKISWNLFSPSSGLGFAWWISLFRSHFMGIRMDDISVLFHSFYCSFAKLAFANKEFNEIYLLAALRLSLSRWYLRWNVLGHLFSPDIFPHRVRLYMLFSLRLSFSARTLPTKG